MDLLLEICNFGDKLNATNNKIVIIEGKLEQKKLRNEIFKSEELVKRKEEENNKIKQAWYSKEKQWKTEENSLNAKIEADNKEIQTLRKVTKKYLEEINVLKDEKVQHRIEMEKTAFKLKEREKKNELDRLNRDFLNQIYKNN